MTKEQRFFLNILSDHIAGSGTNKIKNVNWETITEMAHSHQVEGIVYFQCKSFIPAEKQMYFEKIFSFSFYYYKHRKMILERLTKTCNIKGIPFFTVKGVQVAKYYPVPALRTMGDIDLVVRADDKELVSKELLDMGFEYNVEYEGKERRFCYQGMHFDLHDHLIYDEDITLREHKAFFNNCWQYVEKGVLNPNFHFLFIIVHLRKHLMNRGAGFRMFLDLAAISQNENQLNWSWIEDQLQSLKIIEFSKVCFGLVDEWFNIKVPIAYPELEKSFVDNISEKIFANGIFGYGCDDNNNNNLINNIRVHKGPRWVRRLSIISEKAFPSYRYLKDGDNYKFLKKHPFLLPIAWVYRCFLFVRGKMPGGSNAISSLLINNELIDSREEELRRWGLIE